MVLGTADAQRFRRVYHEGQGIECMLYASVCCFPRHISIKPGDAKHDKEALANTLLTSGDVVRAEFVAIAKYAKEFGCKPKFNDESRPKILKNHLSTSS